MSDKFRLSRSPLAKALTLGWVPPLQDSLGIYVVHKDAMKISYPESLYENQIESSGFWSLGRSSEILKEINTLGIRSLVEVGAGSGDVCANIASSELDVLAIEPLWNGCLSLAKRQITTICATLEELKLPDESVSAYGSFDVLEHLEHPEVLVSEFYRTLELGGYLLVTVPTGSWLWGYMDEILGHQRRYKRSEIEDLLQKAGFTVISSRYVFFSLVIPAFIIRAVPYRLKMRKVNQREFRQLVKLQSPSNSASKIGSAVLSIERKIAKRFKLPYGLTCLVVARKS
jgi:SAM-dependent methyltransferase